MICGAWNHVKFCGSQRFENTDKAQKTITHVIYIYIYIHFFMYISKKRNTCKHIFIYTYFLFGYISIGIFFWHTYIYIYIHVCKLLQYVEMYVYMYIYMYVWKYWNVISNTHECHNVHIFVIVNISCVKFARLMIFLYVHMPTLS